MANSTISQKDIKAIIRNIMDAGTFGVLPMKLLPHQNHALDMFRKRYPSTSFYWETPEKRFAEWARKFNEQNSNKENTMGTTKDKFYKSTVIVNGDDRVDEFCRRLCQVDARKASEVVHGMIENWLEFDDMNRSKAVNEVISAHSSLDEVTAKAKRAVNDVAAGFISAYNSASALYRVEDARKGLNDAKDALDNYDKNRAPHRSVNAS